MERTVYDTYIQILVNELVPALGSTESIAIALAGDPSLGLEALSKVTPPHCGIIRPTYG